MSGLFGPSGSKAADPTPAPARDHEMFRQPTGTGGHVTATGTLAAVTPPGFHDAVLFDGLVAPTAIAFAAGVNTPLDQVILLFFAGCGVSRLARYNVTAESLSAQKGKVEFFEGTPIPTSIVPLGILMLAFHSGHLYRVTLLGVEWHLIALLFFVSGSLMISKTLRIPKP